MDKINIKAIAGIEWYSYKNYNKTDINIDVTWT